MLKGKPNKKSNTGAIGKPNTAARMTASVLKQDPNTRKVKQSALYCDKTLHQYMGIFGVMASSFFKLQD